MDPQKTNMPNSGIGITPPVASGNGLPPLPNQPVTPSATFPIAPPASVSQPPAPIASAPTITNTPTPMANTVPIAQVPPRMPAGMLPPKPPAPPIQPVASPYQNMPQPKSSGGSGFGTFLVLLLTALLFFVGGVIGVIYLKTGSLSQEDITAFLSAPSATPTPVPTTTVIPTPTNPITSLTCVDGTTQCKTWSTYISPVCPIAIKLPPAYEKTISGVKVYYDWKVLETTLAQDTVAIGKRFLVDYNEPLDSGERPFIEIDCYRAETPLTSLDDATTYLVKKLADQKLTATVNTSVSKELFDTTVKNVTFIVKELAQEQGEGIIAGSVAYTSDYVLFLKFSTNEGLYGSAYIPVDLTNQTALAGLPNTYWARDQHAIFQNIRLVSDFIAK